MTCASWGAPAGQGCPGHDEAEAPQCRWCFEEAKLSELISPCNCKGSLRYVHLECLRRWQANVMKLGNPNDERAYRCGVCRAHYTSSPLRPNPWRNIYSGAKALSGPLFASLLAFALSGPPSVHLALLVLLLLSTRSQALVGLLLLTAAAALGALYVKGLRLVVRTDSAGQFGLAVIRYGAPIEGLQPGSLLIAGDGLEGSIFGRSVVLVTHAGRHGTRGVMLTQPLDSSSDADHSRPLHMALGADAPDLAALRHAITHHIGGPVGAARHATAAAAVGMPGGRRRGAAGSELVLLHHLGAVPGASQLLPPAPGTLPEPVLAATAAAAQRKPNWGAAVRGHVVAAAAALLRRPGGGAGGSGGRSGATGQSGMRADQQQQQQRAALAGVGLYHGGAVDDVLRRLAAAAPPPPGRGGQRGPARTVAAPAAAPPAGPKQDAPVPQRVRVYHGICSWTAGQLEGEIRGGLWGLLPQAAVADVAATPPQQVWQALTDSGRVQWL